MTRHARRKGAGEAAAPGGGAPRPPWRDAVVEAVIIPPADVNESADGVVIRMELPGVASSDVEVWIQGSTIEVVGEKRRDPCSEANFLCIERTFGRFRRAFELSGSLNMARTSASLGGGMLVLFVPKCDERRGRRRRVPVATGDGTRREGAENAPGGDRT